MQLSYQSILASTGSYYLLKEKYSAIQQLCLHKSHRQSNAFPAWILKIMLKPCFLNHGLSNDQNVLVQKPRCAKCFIMEYSSLEMALSIFSEVAQGELPWIRKLLKRFQNTQKSQTVLGQTFCTAIFIHKSWFNGYGFSLARFYPLGVSKWRIGFDLALDLTGI